MKITTISDGIVQLNQQHQHRGEEKAEIGGVYGYDRCEASVG